MNNLISIIIPIYNVAPYLEKCLDSVAHQTYQDLEVLLVDDCGTDESMDIAEHFINQYNGPIRFEILRHERNRGLSAARNTGINAAKGEYISFIDSDDYIDPIFYQVLLNAIESKDSSAGIVACGHYKDIEGQIQEGTIGITSSASYIIKPEEYAERMLLMKSPHMAWGKLFRKSIFEQVRFREGVNNEDILFALDFYPQVERDKILTLVIPDRLYYYRQRPGSICHSTTSPFVYTELKNSVIVIETIKQDKPLLYQMLKRKFLYDVFHQLMGTRGKKTPYHNMFFKYAELLKSIEDSYAYVLLTKKEFISFLSIKYFPKLYLPLMS